VSVAGTEPSMGNGDLWYDTANDLLYVKNTSGILVCVTPVAARVVGQAGTTTSTTYTATLTGSSGPAVSIRTGTKAIVTIHSQMSNTGANFSIAAFAVSGASTIPASDASAIAPNDQPTGGRVGGTFYVTGLTPGINTFTMRYRVTGGTGSFNDRHITVVGVP